MNEITILMHLLSKKIESFQMGATQEEIIKILNINGKNESIYFQNLIRHLSNFIKPLGLQIRFNSLSSRWYIAFEMDTADLISANPFEDKPRLAATLFCTIICCLKSKGSGSIQQVKDIRKKKHVLADLKELEEMGYLDLYENLNRVKLTPLIGYHLDLNNLFIKLSLKLKNNEFQFKK